ncbi:hypothetical protein QUH32_29195, partial [Klebsiella pneumoniae]|nr:hypothetical protein [Klebsiella pneumoniae]
CEVLSRADNRAAVAQAVALLSDARQVGIFGIGASGILAEYTASVHLINATAARSGIDGALHQDGVVTVDLHSPAADVVAM